MKKVVKYILLSLVSFALVKVGYAAEAGGEAATGIGSVAATATSNLADIARLITAASYVAGMAFGVGAIVKFKAHKDNPTQIPIGTPIALLFVGAALIFIPSVYQVSGSTLFGAEGKAGGIGGEGFLEIQEGGGGQ